MVTSCKAKIDYKADTLTTARAVPDALSDDPDCRKSRPLNDYDQSSLHPIEAPNLSLLFGHLRGKLHRRYVVLILLEKGAPLSKAVGVITERLQFGMYRLFVGLLTLTHGDHHGTIAVSFGNAIRSALKSVGSNPRTKVDHGKQLFLREVWKLL